MLFFRGLLFPDWSLPCYETDRPMSLATSQKIYAHNCTKIDQRYLGILYFNFPTGFVTFRWSHLCKIASPSKYKVFLLLQVLHLNYQLDIPLFKYTKTPFKTPTINLLHFNIKLILYLALIFIYFR